VHPLEMLEVQLANTTAPFILISRLRAALAASPTRSTYVVKGSTRRWTSWMVRPMMTYTQIHRSDCRRLWSRTVAAGDRMLVKSAANALHSRA
jgi:hypothetical protein